MLMVNVTEIIIEFQVVNSKFPVPRRGILGHAFLKNKTIIDSINNTQTINAATNKLE